MPKRSNEFQALIRYLYEELVPVGVIVEESVLLADSTDGNAGDREIDVLLTQEIAGIKVRIAVECRDRRRKADVQWIDELIGKFLRTGVSKIVAVSSSGFTKSALAKAAEHNIETKTLTEAIEADWPSQFLRLGFARFQAVPSVRRYHLEFDPPITEPVDPEWITIGKDGQESPLEEFLARLFGETCEKALSTFLQTDLPSKFVSLETMKGGIPFEYGVECFVSVRTGSDQVHRVKNVGFEAVSTATIDHLPVDRSVFETACVTSGIDDQADVTITAIQVDGKPQGRVIVTPRNTDTSKDKGCTG